MIDLNAHVADIVASDYRSASVFRKYGIDFCCGGGKTIDSICEKKGINRNQLVEELKELYIKNNLYENRYSDWPYNKLIDYIVDKHHDYVKRTTSTLDQYLTKVAKVHGNHNPELIEILKIYKVISKELLLHMEKEEMDLFPYIKEMVQCEKNGNELKTTTFGSIIGLIARMETEHESAEIHLKEIRRLTNDYTPPSHACNTYMVSFKLLEEFELDLQKHMHLENNILFPGAIELEKQLLQ